MNKLKMLLVTLGMLAPMMFAPAASAAGTWNPFGRVDCSSARESAICQERGTVKDPVTGPNGLLAKITNLIAILAGVAAVIIIILAGLRFVQSGGSSEDVAGARRALIYATVGLVVIVLARALIFLVLSKL
jgi:hypothetical protein